MAGTLMRLLLLCGGLAMVAPAVVAQDECWEDDCEDSAGPPAQDEASDWSDDADSEQSWEEEDDSGCAEGACDTGDEPLDPDDGLDADSDDSGDQAFEEAEDAEDSSTDSASPPAEAPRPAAAPPPPAPTRAPEAVPAAPGAVTEANDDNFQALVLQSNLLVLVFFTADWCQPCNVMQPVLAEVARDYAGRARIVSVNVDQSPELSNTYSLKGVPLIVMIKGGQVVNKLPGVPSSRELRSAIEGKL